MQNNPKCINSSISIQMPPAVSKVTSAKKSGALGKHTISYSKDDEIKQKYKEQRYKTQSIIQKILSNCAGKWRVTGCGKKRITKLAPVGVQYNPATKSASFTNVLMCGLRWLCPVCLERQARQERDFVEKIIVFMQKKGFYAHMVTFTVPHRKHDSLNDLITKMKSSRKRFFGDRANVAFFDDKFPYIGHLSAMEIKYSDENGWHPHFHTILFTKEAYSEKELSGTLKRPNLKTNEKGKICSDSNLGIAQEMSLMWMNACKAVGLRTPDFKHGLDVKRGYDDDERQDSAGLIKYALKATIAAEIALSHTKTGRFNTESLTPFEIALMAENEGDVEDPNSKYSQLFYEYACATKSKAMVEPSRKLKQFLTDNHFYSQPEKKTEDDLDLDQEQQPVLVFEFTDLEWRLLCADYKARGKILVLIEQDISEYGIGTSKFHRTNNFLNKILGDSNEHQLRT